MSAAEEQWLCADNLTAVLNEFVDSRAVPGVLAVVTDVDRLVYTGACGFAQRRAGIAIAPDTIFRIASMTKVITSVAVLMLADEGKVELDAPLSRYVPGYRQPPVLRFFDHSSGQYETRPAREEVTVRRLLSHTSGYGYWFLDDRLLQLVDGEPDLLQAPFLIDEPGSRWHYSTSTDVLAQLIEPVSGQPLETFIAQRIGKPLGMRDTGFALPAKTERLASVFDRTADGFNELDLETSGPAPRGGGGLYSTADDYCRLLRMLLNRGAARGKQLLSESLWNAMTSNQIGDLRANVQTTAVPGRSNDFIFMNGSQQFGLGLALETVNQPTGRPAGSASWAGIWNTYFWVDFTNELAGAVFMQVRPFADVWCVELCRRFEAALYDCLAQ